MSCSVTGLGQTLDQYTIINGDVRLADLFHQLVEKEEGAKRVKAHLGEMAIENGGIVKSGDKLCELDNAGYEMIGKMLCIPTPYLLKLSAELKKANIEFWFSQYGEKEVEITIKDGLLIDLVENMRIEMTDVLRIANAVMPDAHVFNVVQQTNATQIDVYTDSEVFETERDTYLRGMRIIVKDRLAAPEISPIFINTSSCGIVEMSSYLEKLIIKNLTYHDILRTIMERMRNCSDAAAPLFAIFRDIAGDEVHDPRRRIQHYCKEHNVPERVAAYAAKAYDDSGFSGASIEDLVCLFSTLGFVDEVKQSSVRKLSQLAGHIIVCSRGEKRCAACDAMLIEE